MTKYNFITDNLRFSYSSLSTYNTCAYAFKLTYIDSADRGKNFYSDFGTLCHKVLEEYFKNNLKENELLDYYNDNFDLFMTSPEPSYIKDAKNKYYKYGEKFFKEFKFDKSLYDIEMIEDSLKFDYFSKNVIVKPDLLLKNKVSKKVTLWDYKTAKIVKSNGKLDEEKMNGYKHQMFLYCLGLFESKDIVVDDISIWFIRDNIIETFKMDINEQLETIEWITGTLNSIDNDEVFQPNLENKFFCNNICGVSASCSYKLAKSSDL